MSWFKKKKEADVGGKAAKGEVGMTITVKNYTVVVEKAIAEGACSLFTSLATGLVP